MGTEGMTLPGWTCACGCFNGEAKTLLPACRACDAPRPRSSPRLVILESPYAASARYSRDGNVAYARACVRDSLLRGEAPMASHLLYAQVGVLDDDDVEQRAIGLEAGLAWGRAARATVVYVDRGVSRGMRVGIERARTEERPVELRSLVSDGASDDGAEVREIARRASDPEVFDGLF